MTAPLRNTETRNTETRNTEFASRLKQRLLLASVLLFWLLGVCMFPRECPAQVDKSAAVRLLGSKGLVPVGDAWCLPEEVRLKEALDNLDRLERRCQTCRQQAEELTQRNRANGLELQQLQAQLKQSQESLKAQTLSTAQRAAAEEEIKNQIARLQVATARYIPPDAWGQEPPLKPLLQDWTQARQELMLSMLFARATIPGLETRYAPWRENQEVSHALRVLGAPTGLGPLGKYDSVNRQTAKIEQSIFATGVPVYREGRKFRVGVILNEQTPATFTVQESGGTTWIPASLAEAAGLTIPSEARQSVIRPTADRSLTVHGVTIPQLRLGKWIFKDFEAYILPPEGEDLGALISRDSLPHARIVIDPAALMLRIEQ